MLESVNSISGENPQALEAKEEIKKINANPPVEVGQRTIFSKENYMKAIGIKSPKSRGGNHSRLQKYISL